MTVRTLGKAAAWLEAQPARAVWHVAGGKSGRRQTNGWLLRVRGVQGDVAMDIALRRELG